MQKYTPLILVLQPQGVLMPQLPSGKHLGLDPSPLQKVVSDAYGGLKTHELMAIENIEQLFSHINVLYYRPIEEARSNIPLAKFSTVPPDGLESYFSGFNLVSIKNELDSWSGGDQKAFIEFLNEKRTNRFLEGLLETVKRYQNELMEHPSTLQGMLALWWKLGIHPLQEDEDENG